MPKEKFKYVSKHLRKDIKTDSKIKNEKILFVEWLDNILNTYKANNLLENSKSHLPLSKPNFKKEESRFCDECGSLMFPSKLDDKTIIKCKCGIIKPLFENSINSYKITTNIKHSYKEENIYLSTCGKKFQTQTAFLNHSSTCQKCKEIKIESIKKIKEEKLKKQKQREADRKSEEKLMKLRQKRELIEERRKKEKEMREIMKSHFNKVIYHCVCGTKLTEENYHSDGSFFNHWHRHQYPLSYYAIRTQIENVFHFFWYNKGKKLIEDSYQSEGLLYRHRNDKGEKGVDCFKIVVIIYPKKHEAKVYINLINSTLSKSG